MQTALASTRLTAAAAMQQRRRTQTSSLRRPIAVRATGDGGDAVSLRLFLRPISTRESCSLYLFDVLEHEGERKVVICRQV